MALLATLGLVLVAFSPADTVIQQTGTSDERGITVGGVGKAEATPDVAVFDVGVEVTAPDVATARDQAAEAATGVIAALKQAGVADKDIQTRGLNVSPNYDYPKDGGTPTIVSFRVSNIVNVKVRDIGRAGEAVDAAVAAGGDATRLHGIRFEVSDAAKVAEEARQRAVEDARSKAEQLAQAAGVKLGDALMIQEVAGTPEWALQSSAYTRDMAAGAPMPVEPGTNIVQVQVAVRWEIR